MGTADERFVHGYYLVEFTSVSQTEQEGETDLVCKCLPYFEMPATKRWFYKEYREEEVINLYNVVAAKIDLMPMSEDNKPSTKNGTESCRCWC